MDNEVKIGERTFRIKKFSARDGSFLMIKVAGIIGGMYKNVDLGKLMKADKEKLDLSAFNFSGIFSELGNLDEKDFNYIQGKCLGVCYEVLPGGLTPVLDENGNFGVTGLEEDTITVMALTAHPLIHNFKGFFQGSNLSGLMNGLLSTSR